MMDRDLFSATRRAWCRRAPLEYIAMRPGVASKPVRAEGAHAERVSLDVSSAELAGGEVTSRRPGRPKWGDKDETSRGRRGVHWRAARAWRHARAQSHRAVGPDWSVVVARDDNQR